MKKVLALALAVLGFTAAQAVTVNWTGTASGDLSQTVSFADASKFYASVTLAGDLTGMWNAAAAGNARPDMVTLKDSADNVVMDVNFRKQGGWFVQVNGTDHRLDGYLTDITVIFEATKDGEKWSNIAVTVSGKSGDDVRTLIGTITDASIITDIASVEIGGAIGDVAIPSTTVVASTTVPEPTALALLALGVAGLALKRKNA